jgi:hypothetical protein
VHSRVNNGLGDGVGLWVRARSRALSVDGDNGAGVIGGWWSEGRLSPAIGVVDLGEGLPRGIVFFKASFTVELETTTVCCRVQQVGCCGEAKTITS